MILIKHNSFEVRFSPSKMNMENTRGGFTIEFSEMRGPNKIFGSFCKINEPNILFGPLISENSIVTPPLVLPSPYSLYPAKTDCEN